MMFRDDFRKEYGHIGGFLFRIVVGFLFMLHGLSKFGLLGGGVKMPGDIMLVAALIEAIGGLLVLLGLFTTWASFIAAGQMAVAYWWKHAFTKGAGLFWNPLANGGELAALFCFAFLLIWFYGAGKYSLDAKMKG